MKVSVVIAVHNGTWCIEAAIRSLLEQTVRPDEIVVGDDASTDGTPDLLERRFGDAVKILRLPRGNASKTRIATIAEARGEWLAYMDADDVWMPTKLERQLAVLREHPDVRHISSDGALVSAEGIVRPSWLSDYFNPVRPLYHGDLYPLLLERCFVLMSSTMVHREAFDALGGMDPSLVYSHDYDMWLKVMGRYPAAVVGEPLIHYFTSPQALSRNFEARHRDDLELMRRAARGHYRRDPALQRRARQRQAALEYKVGIQCMRSARIPEGRELLRRASARGPWSRRLLAFAGSLVPAWAIGTLKASPWLKARVGDDIPTPIETNMDDEKRGAA